MEAGGDGNVVGWGKQNSIPLTVKEGEEIDNHSQEAYESGMRAKRKREGAIKLGTTWSTTGVVPLGKAVVVV